MMSKTGVSSFFIYIKECLECLSYAVVKRKKKHLGVPLKENENQQWGDVMLAHFQLFSYKQWILN